MVYMMVSGCVTEDCEENPAKPQRRPRALSVTPFAGLSTTYVFKQPRTAPRLDHVAIKGDVLPPTPSTHESVRQARQPRTAGPARPAPPRPLPPADRAAAAPGHRRRPAAPPCGPPGPCRRCPSGVGAAPWPWPRGLRQPGPCGGARRRRPQHSP